VVAYLLTGVSLVGTEEVGFVRSFGAVVREDLPPGLYVHAPWPFAILDRVAPERVRRIEVGFTSPGGEWLAAGMPADTPEDKRTTLPVESFKLPQESFLLTGDENLIDVTATVHYQVTKPAVYLYGWTDVDELVHGLALSGLIHSLAADNIDGIYTTDREDIERKVFTTVQQCLDAYDAGVVLLKVSLVDVHAPPEVHPRFRDVASAMEDRERYINEAHVYREDVLNKARGESHRIEAEGEAIRDALIQKARGEVAGFLAQAGQYHLTPTAWKYRLYLEVLEEQLPGVRKIIRPVGPGAPQVDLWRLDLGTGGTGAVSDIQRYFQQRTAEER
jgi:HflK protein